MTMTPELTGGFDSELSIRGYGAATWMLTAPLIWTGTKGDTFTVPIGFITDFATVPRFLRWLVLPYGPYTRAAVLHDWLLVALADWTAHGPGTGYAGTNSSNPPATSREADGVFRVAMHDLGTPWLLRWVMWTGVRWASLFSSRRAYGRRIARDLPAMLGVSLLVLCSVLIPVAALAVLLALGLVRLVSPQPRPVEVRSSRRDNPPHSRREPS